MGGYIPMVNVALAHYFGRQHMGAIRGVATPVATVTGAITPFAIGSMWQLHGNYDVAFMLLGAGWFIGGTVRAGGKAAEGAVGRGRDEAALSLTG